MWLFTLAYRHKAIWRAKDLENVLPKMFNLFPLSHNSFKRLLLPMRQRAFSCGNRLNTCYTNAIKMQGQVCKKNNNVIYFQAMRKPTFKTVSC